MLEIRWGFRMEAHAKRKRRLWDAYAFAGFRPERTVRGIFGDPKARIIKLLRRSKKRAAAVVDARIAVGTIAQFVVCATFRVAIRGSISSSRSDASFAGFAAK